jgi:hypothetical protein
MVYNHYLFTLFLLFHAKPVNGDPALKPFTLMSTDKIDDQGYRWEHSGSFLIARIVVLITNRPSVYPDETLPLPRKPLRSTYLAAAQPW